MWNISIGEIQGKLSTGEAELLSAVGTAFSQGYTDALNAPAHEFAVAIERDGEQSFSITHKALAHKSHTKRHS